ncbi:NADP-dependent oxidoreductase [Jannaschia pagri]|uniref:NADP-dependent oxidoreductase n=1 Tax=Jannaschia pagri TaxID=2829797 RepID=A0ABQ4NR82_9RHOB|nr:MULTISPECIES: aldo/keto reductase [unclassified Jannaschia]GIT93060.1 NADP-dependent oxidoreductase [Jannaschia sp. AI_61]GIT96895.1 NADP-dependent oxidoreductase [Jannaschia sp. AI_62]
MRSIPLGRDDTISEIMLGTMTFGTQTSEADAHTQIDMAVDAGVTWLDTAEMYPVNPVRAETVGLTEQIIGRWVAQGNAGRIRIATKHSGEGAHARDGAPITAETIPQAIEGSLKRLQSETIDLYQFHWPNRGSFQFRQYWDYAPRGDRAEVLDNMAACLEALEQEVKRGTIRAFGLSNESTWGMDHWLRLSEAGHGPRAVAIQNEYSLMCRIADTDLTEMMCHEQVTMLAFSPLATGILTGKYLNGAVPEGSRKSLNDGLGGRWSDRVDPAVTAYLDIATRHGLDPVHMSLAWLQSRPFACSAILGATTVAQLEHGLKAQDMTLSDEVLAEIAGAHKAHPMPY